MNKQTKKEKKMKKTQTQVKEVNNETSILQIVGGLFIAFAIADFAMSWMGTNLTSFMGPVSRFSPMIFGFIGAALMNVGGKEDG